jgi:hypothetical protein
MSTLYQLGTIVLGVLLRIGVPLAGTMLFIWLLRRLDVRWKAEAEKERAAHPAAGAVIVQTRCWEKKNCPAAARAKCAAYAEQDTPCWQVHRRATGQLRDSCLGCDVFRQMPVPIPG